MNCLFLLKKRLLEKYGTGQGRQGTPLQVQIRVFPEWVRVRVRVRVTRVRVRVTPPVVWLGLRSAPLHAFEKSVVGP